MRAAAATATCVVLATLLASGSATPGAAMGRGGVPHPTPATPTPAQLAAALVARMTLPEKVSQLTNNAAAIPRLGVPSYGWWSEALHGVAWSGVATVFPTPMAWGAAFDPPLTHLVGTAVGDEGRGKHHFATVAQGTNASATFYGLTFYAPNLNLFRDPRWGRGLETPGEDPVLTAAVAGAYIRGLQGNDTRYLKVAATAKHLFAYSLDRMPPRLSFDPNISNADMLQTYSWAPRHAVSPDVGVASVMCAYSGVNGHPSCASPYLESELLRGDMGFSGFVVSDCGAVEFIQTKHHIAATPEEAVAYAMTNGTDMDCGSIYGTSATQSAISQGLMSEADVDRSVMRSMTARFRLGMFDDSSSQANPYANITIDVVNSAPHRALAKRAATEGIVLLKNNATSGHALPLDASVVKTVAVIGPNANSSWVLLGNYYGCTSGPNDYSINASCTLSTVLDGISARAGTTTTFARGCDINSDDTSGFAEAIAAAKGSDAVVMAMGLRTCTPPGPHPQADCVESEGHDRDTLGLPGVQQQLLQQVATEVGGTKPVVLVLLNGGAVSTPWAASSAGVTSIVEAWYPGQAGGLAIADVLWGDAAPAGRLPVTVYANVSQLPPETDMGMASPPFGRTHRYFTGEPLYAFGFGLSYARFSYSGASVTPPSVPAPGAKHVADRGRAQGDTGSAAVVVAADVTRSGSAAADEVTMVFARYMGTGGANTSYPLQQLVGFVRTPAASFTAAVSSRGRSQGSTDGGSDAATVTVSVEVDVAQLALVGDDGTLAVQVGTYRMWIGGRAPGSVGSGADDASVPAPLALELTVTAGLV